MALPRTLIGAGAGALIGGGIGAASGDPEKRRERALKGALAGGLVGGLGHGALRTKKLHSSGFIPHESFRKVLSGPGKSTLYAQTKPKKKKLLSKIWRGAGALGEGFAGSRSIKSIRKADPFMGATTKKELKNIYRQVARTAHPDKPGGSAESFKKAREMFELHRDFRFPEKTSSASVFWSSFFDEIEKLSAKNPLSLKVPKPGTNLKGMERFTANPGKTPVTAPGKVNASLASSSGVGHSLSVGRTGTSAQPTPHPAAVTS